MHNKFTITIQDINGVKQYTLHQIIKRVAFYGVTLLLAVLVIGTFSIIYLNNSLDTLEEKKDQLLYRNDALQKFNAATEQALNDKKEELSVVSDRLENIEELIGLSPAQNVSLVERADMATLTSSDRAKIFQYVPSGSPVEYKGITSKFGYRTHPTLKTREFHRGSDMKAPMKTPIYATADAAVEYAADHKKSGYGKLIILDHSFGFKTYYGHLKKIAVKAGEFVKKGDLIGYTGNSGMSNGPHLHYEVRFIQRPLNPYWFVKWDQENYTQIFEKEKRVPWQSLITAITQREQPAAVPPSSPKVLLSRAN